MSTLRLCRLEQTYVLVMSASTTICVEKHAIASGVIRDAAIDGMLRDHDQSDTVTAIAKHTIQRDNLRCRKSYPG